MDPRLLRYYNRELLHIREMGGEFAKEFPKIAARLGLEGFECADPYVERLLEGFAFLAARVQLKLDAEFPNFTQHLLEMVYPHYLCPTPSMAVVQLKPDLGQGALGAGFPIPRGTALRSLLGKGEQTPCEYRTSHDVTLWPLELAAAEYLPHPRDLPSSGAAWLSSAKAALRLKLRATAGLTFDKMPLTALPVFLRGGGELPQHLYEQLLANSLGLVVGPPERPWYELVPRAQIRRLGYDEEHALLPHGPRSFEGYRLLQEYFAFPERFMFIEFAGLAPAARRCAGSELDVTVVLSRTDPALESTVDASHFGLFCTPAINLFPKRADRIHVSDQVNEFHVVPDRTRPMDFETFAVTEVVGFGTSQEQEQEFLPFYAHSDLSHQGAEAAYYTVRRAARVLSAQQRRYGPRSSYAGSETYLSLVDAKQAPYSTDLRQLAVGTLCTNRDLPLNMPLGQRQTDFTLETGAPVEAVRAVAGPTKPRPSHAEGDTAWRLISHLSLNYLSLTDTDEKQGAVALRDLLALYAPTADAPVRKQIEGVRSVRPRPVNRRIPTTGPIAFGRGIEVTLTLDDSAFGGGGGFLLGSVLEQFFARYVSMNSFTETVVRTVDRGEIVRWPARTGRRLLL
ncbi:MAG: type VI secretion system baseplate subunit TssF [Deltaproteobacteria bacterium]|nr:type VI secretion system baseplate subunit TssF [Deltaproteobacteria bacterium]